jgi:hypothetical protein
MSAPTAGCDQQRPWGSQLFCDEWTGPAWSACGSHTRAKWACIANILITTRSDTQYIKKKHTYTQTHTNTRTHTYTRDARILTAVEGTPENQPRM